MTTCRQSLLTNIPDRSPSHISSSRSWTRGVSFLPQLQPISVRSVAASVECCSVHLAAIRSPDIISSPESEASASPIQHAEDEQPVPVQPEELHNIVTIHSKWNYLLLLKCPVARHKCATNWCLVHMINQTMSIRSRLNLPLFKKQMHQFL